MGLREFFVPAGRPGSGAAMRAGRAIYWLGASVVATLMLVILAALAHGLIAASWDSLLEVLSTGLPIAIPAWMIGRLARYILARE